MRSLLGLIRPLVPVSLFVASVLLNTTGGRAFAIRSLGQTPHFTAVMGSVLFAAGYFVLLFQHVDIRPPFGCLEAGCFTAFLFCVGLMILAIYYSYASTRYASQWKPIRNVTILLVFCVIAAEKRAEWPFKRGIIRRILDLRPAALSESRRLQAMLRASGIVSLLISIILEADDFVRGAPTRWAGLIALILAIYLFRMRSISPCPNCGYSGRHKTDIESKPNPDWDPLKYARDVEIALKHFQMESKEYIWWRGTHPGEDPGPGPVWEPPPDNSCLGLLFLVCPRCNYRWKPG